MMSNNNTELDATDNLAVRLEEAQALVEMMLEGFEFAERKEANGEAIFSQENIHAALNVVTRVLNEARASARTLDKIRATHCA